MASTNQRIKGITIEIGGETTKLQSALKGVNSDIAKTQSALKDVKSLLKLDPSSTELLKQQQQLLAKEVESTKEKLQMEKEALEQMKNSGDASQTIEQQQALEREIISTTQYLKDLEEQAKETGSVLGTQMQQAGEKISNAGRSISEAGSTMTKSVTAPIVGAGAAAVKTAVDFEDAMAKVSTIADTGAVPLEDLQKQIIDLSNETGIAATDIADNVYNAISAGQQTGDAVNFVSNAAKLAKAGFTDSSAALDILTTTLNAYGMEAEEVTRVSDVLINTQNLGKTTVNELASSMGKVIPTAKANNVELEDLAGAYAVMTANGIATAETTTYLNSMLNELGKQGTSAFKAFAEGTENIKEGGLTLAEAMEMGWELTDVLSVLDEQAAESGTTISNMFGSAEAGKAANVLWDQADKLNSAVSSMADSAGATEEAFGKLDTTSFQVQQTLNELKNTGIDLGTNVLEMISPYLKDLMEDVKQLTQWFSGLDEEQKKTIITILGIIAAIGPAMIVIGKVITLVGSVITNVGLFATFMGGTVIPLITGTIIPTIGTVIAVIAPFLPLIIGITAAIVAVIAIVKNWGEISEWFSGKWEELKEKVATTSEIFEELKESAKSWGKDMIDNFVNSIEENLQKVKDAAKNIAQSVRDFIGFSEPKKGPLSNFHTFMPDMLDLMSEGIENNMGILDKPMNELASTLIPTNRATDLSEVTSLMNTYLPGLGNNKVEVVLQGDAAGLFRMVRQENKSYMKSTGKSAF